MATKYGLSPEQVEQIRRLAKTHSGPQIAERLGVGYPYIEFAVRIHNISLCKDGLNIPAEGEFFDWACYPEDSIFVSYNPYNR